MLIGVLQGPNLNRLGRRDPVRYGTHTLHDIEQDVLKTARELDVEVRQFQSNHEGFLIDWLQDNGDDLDGLILNAAALTRYGRSLMNAVQDANLPLAVVHISQVFKHAGEQHNDLFAPLADFYLVGLGWTAYSTALRRLVDRLRDTDR